MIVDYSDPKVTLNQVYRATTAGSTAVLGTCVIGPLYTIRSYKSNGQALLLASDEDFVATTGIAAKAIGDLIGADANATIDAVKIFVKDAQIQYYDSSSKAITVGANSTLTIAGQKFSGNAMTTKLTVEVGDKVKYYTADSESKQTVVTETTADSITLAAAIQAGASLTKITIAKVTDVYLDNTAYSITTNTVTVKANPKVTIDLGSGSQTYTVIGGNFYVQYRKLNQTYKNRINVIAASTDAQVEEELGQVCADNPLAMAVACATYAASGRFVYYVTIDSDSLENYLEAFDLIAQNDAIHGVVPCTSDMSILKELKNRIVALTGSQTTAEVIPFFKYLYGSVDVPAEVTNKAQTIADIIQKNVLKSERASIVFADGATHNGIEVPNYCVAAAVAGLRSAAYPHAPLSNVVLPGIQVANTHGFTASNMKNLGANGFLRIGQNASGSTVILRQLTSAASNDVNKDEQSIVCDIDSICLNIKNTGARLVGNANISPALIDLLRVQLTNNLDSYMYYTNQLIGPQLLSASLDKIEQSQVHKDRIYATITGQPPKPFNRFHITFRMV